MFDIQQEFETLRHGFDSGILERDAYWEAARSLHTAAADYAYLRPYGRFATAGTEGGETRISLTNGLTFSWRPEEPREAVSILVNHGDYEPEERLILEAIAETTEVVIDIGANIGWYAVHLASVLPDRGHLFAFEPARTTFHRLCRNIALNCLEDKITPRNCALAEEPGVAVLHVPAFSGSPAASLRNLQPAEGGREVECRVRTLDAEIESLGVSGVELIKCDVEGAEFSVLKGGTKMIERDRPIIFLEMLRKWSKVFGYSPNDIISFLGNFGYRCWGVGRKGLRPVSKVSEQAKETNFVFAIMDRHRDVILRFSAGRL